MTIDIFEEWCKKIDMMPLTGDALQQKVERLILTDGKDCIRPYVMMRLLIAMKVSQIYDHKSYKEGIEVIEVLLYFGCLQKSKRLVPFSEVERWRQAIGYLKYMRYRTPQGNFMPSPDLADLYLSAYNILKPCNTKLSCHISGYETNNHDNKCFDIQIRGIEKICKTIEDNVREIGGKRFIETLLSKLSYDDAIGRFLLVHAGINRPKPEIELEIPYGWILNLGMKYINLEGKKDDKLTKQTIRLMQAVGFVYTPVQRLSIWDDVFARYQDPLLLLGDLIVRHSIFSLQQSSVAFVKSFVHFLKDRVGELLKREKIALPFSLDDYIVMMEEEMSLSRPHQFVYISKHRFCKGLANSSRLALINEVSLRANAVNKDFAQIDDFANSNCQDHPFLEKSNCVLILPTSIGTYGWIESLLRIVRCRYPDIDKKVGSFVEEYVKEQFAQKDISNICGKYKVKIDGKTIDGECDHVVESSNNLLFIEDKKKPLTRFAQKGILYQVIIDIGGIFLNSQQQCMTHAAALSKAGMLLLNDYGTTNELRWKGKNLHLITLSLQDYGPIQSGVLLENLLRCFIGHEVHIDFSSLPSTMFNKKERDEIKSKLDELNRHIRKMTNAYKNLCNIKRWHAGVFTSHFFSLEQMFFIINNAKGNEDFCTAIERIGQVTFGTQDFFTEWRKLNKTSKKNKLWIY